MAIINGCKQFTIAPLSYLSGLAIGDSISVNGIA